VWEPVFTVDHTQVVGTCSSCHDGVTATGKHPTHITSGDNCDDCHTTIAWIPANFDHINIVDNCFSCHNGTEATGKGPLHVQTTNVCEDCHNTTVWEPVTTVDHNQVLGSCSSCHNGTIATGQNPGHFNTSQDCGLCHSPIAWTPADYRHTGLPYEPQDHSGNFLCSRCHQNNSEVVNWQFPAFQPDCAGCHAGDYESGPHKKHENPDRRYTASELRDCSGACHVYTDSSLTTIKDRRSGPEHRISGGDF
jgi:predicted CXXCH cytochrome family protein